MLFTIKSKGPNPSDVEVFDQDGNKLQHIKKLVITLDRDLPHAIIDIEFIMPKVQVELRGVGVPNNSYDKIDPYDTSFENSTVGL